VGRAEDVTAGSRICRSRSHSNVGNQVLIVEKQTRRIVAIVPAQT
jgi:hypothetical protein